MPLKYLKFCFMDEFLNYKQDETEFFKIYFLIYGFSDCEQYSAFYSVNDG